MTHSRKNDHGILGLNRLFNVHAVILAGPLAPDHWRPICRVQRANLPALGELARHDELRFLLQTLSRNQDKGPSWLSIAVEINPDQTGASRAVVLLIQPSIVLLQIHQTDEVGAGVFLGDFVAEAWWILTSLREWCSTNHLTASNQEKTRGTSLYGLQTHAR